MRTYSLLTLSLTAVVVAGCGGPRRAPVSGRVTLDGKPLPSATVFFQPLGSPDQPNPGRGSMGETNAEGVYTLQGVGGDGPGAVVGKHKVTISALQGPPPKPTDDNPPPRKNLVPSRYNTATTLTFDVPPGGTKAADFALTSP